MRNQKIMFVFIAVSAAGLSIWGLMLILTWKVDKPHALLIELGKTGASLSLVTAIGGLIQWMLKGRDAVLEKQKETLNFYRHVLTDFKSVYDKVEKARLLIQAHRSAKTYGEQMRELIEGVVILHNIKRALNPEFPTLKAQLVPHINAMSVFLKDLLNEYRDNYKKISVLQEIDQKRKEKFIEQTINSPVSEISDNNIPSGSWIQIENLKRLGALKDENHSNYESGFLKHLDQASAIVRQKIPVQPGN